MRDTNEEYWEIVKGVLGGIIILAIFIIFFLSGCKSIKGIKSNSSDSVNVVKSNEGSVKTDSSGTKTDKTNTKETVYYPQPIYIQGKDGETKTVFVPQYIKETGTEKTEESNVSKDESWRSSYDSLKIMIASLSKDSKTTVLGFWQILSICLGAVIVIFLIRKLSTFKLVKI